MESVSETQEYLWEIYWMSLVAPYLELKSQGISSLDSMH